MFFSQYGWTALHHASNSGHTDVVKLLVDSGAQIDNEDNVNTEQSIVLCSFTIFIFIFPTKLTLTEYSVCFISVVDLCIKQIIFTVCSPTSPLLFRLFFPYLTLCLSSHPFFTSLVEYPIIITLNTALT